MPISYRTTRLALFTAALLATAAASLPAFSAEEARVIPAPLSDIKETGTAKTAIFAGGCFWGVQGVFQHVDGVKNAVSGYAGGSKQQADYETVSSGQTGHAEAVEVVYDPRKVSYGRLMQIYFSVAHDPTQLNRQGPDTGTQYRSALFPTDAEQAKVAKAYIDQLDKAHLFDAAIVTRIETGKAFYPAEGYHQDFLNDNPTYPYIVINDMPKIDALKALFPKDFRAEPVLVAKAATSN